MQILNVPLSLISFLGLFNSLLLSAICLAIVWYLKWHSNRRHLYDLAAKVPLAKGVKLFPILGHSPHFFGDTAHFLKIMNHIALNSPSPCTLWLANRLLFAISSPNELEVILNSTKCLNKYDIYRFSKDVAGNGVFSLNGDAWKIHRKLIRPTFKQGILDDFVQIFAQQSNMLVKILSKKVGKIFNVEEYMTSAVTKMVTQTAMGIDINCHEVEPYASTNMNRALEIMFIRMVNIPLHCDFIFNKTTLAKEQKSIIDSFENFTKEVIAVKRITYIKEQEKQTSEIAQINESQRKGFLDHLLELSRNGLFTDQEVIDEVRTFMLAASDTSATMASFVLICLGIHPEYQQTLYEEIVDVIGLDRDVESSDISKLKYLDKCVKETLRLFPGAPVIMREVTERMKVGQYTFPRDCGLIICIQALHRNEKYYPDPLKFDPERFSPEECTNRHPYAFVPFSAGPRNCIGMQFGYAVVKTMIATIVRKFSIETTFKSIEDIQMKQNLVLKSISGFPIKLTSRVTS